MPRPGRAAASAAPALPEPAIERTDEYEKFMTGLAEYHEKRGLVFVG